MLCLILKAALVMGIPPSLLSESDESNFGYYSGDFLTYAMSEDDPLAMLIHKRLAESLFESNNSQTFTSRLRFLKQISEQYPELRLRFSILDEELQMHLNQKLKQGKNKRLIYSAAGSLLGALVAIPIGKTLASSSSLGTKVWWLSIPAGALVGAGAGYLLSGILQSEKEIESQLRSRDLQNIRRELKDSNVHRERE